MNLQPMILGMAAILCGCSSIGPGRETLSGGDLGALQGRSVSPASHGVLIEKSVIGGFYIRGAYRMDRAAETSIALIRHLESGSRNPVIPIQVNGRTLTASVDTGSSFSLITLQAAEATGVAPLGPELIELPTVTFRGTRRPVIAMADRIRLGTLAVGKVPFGILRRIPGMPRVTENSLAEVDVILGQDLLRQFGVVLFEAGRQELHLSGQIAPKILPADRIIQKLPMQRGKTGIPAFEAQVSGRGPIPVVFDSGGGFGLWIPEHTALALQLADARSGSGIERALNRSLKPSSSRPARPSSLRAGAFLADGLPTLIGSIHGGERNPDFVLLGNHILKTTSVAIDYRSGTILFLRK